MSKKQKTIIFIAAVILLLMTLVNFANLKILFSINSFINDKAFVLREKSFEENIVLVNIGSLKRKELAQVIETVSSYQPAVLGLQICLEKDRKTEHDSLLKSSLSKIKNLVLFESSEDGSCRFMNNGRYGTNAFVKDDDEVVRNFSFKDKSYFETEIVRLYSKSAYEMLINRETETEQINFTGNMSQYFAADHSQVLNRQVASDLFAGKIVLLGYLGSTLSPEVRSLESALYTPMNERLNEQKVLPDMYSVVVSANILSTIIQEKYIEEVPFFISILIIAAVIIFNLLIGSLIIENSFSSFFLFAVTAFVTEIFLAGMLIVWLLNEYNQMLYLKELPIAIVLGFIAFIVIHYRTLPRKEEAKVSQIQEESAY